MDHPDYDAPDTLVVREPERLRALGDGVRGKIVWLLRDRAMSIAQLSVELGLPKGTVGHHVKVLERVGLIRVVRTRQVRAVTEKFYGRTARLFLFENDGDPTAVENLAATAVRNAADELDRGGDLRGFGAVHLRLSDEDAERLSQRMKKLLDEFRKREEPDGIALGYVAALYERNRR
jgi:DNA-binding transcriptional ArsR family regulator